MCTGLASTVPWAEMYASVNKRFVHMASLLELLKRMRELQMFDLENDLVV